MRRILEHWRRLNPPVRWFIYFLLAMIALPLLFAPRPQPVDWEEVDFSTHASSRLYFKNVRSYYYQIFTREKPPLVLYRHKRRLRDSSRQALEFMIVENPHTGEAYIFAEANFSADELANSRLVFAANENSPLTSLPLQQLDSEKHFRLAAKVYNQLIRNEQIMLVNGNDTVGELWTSGKLRDNALTVLEDYFKLVHKN